MNAVETRTEQLLQIVSGHIEEVVPFYERSCADVATAIQTGVGNCMSKAVIAAVVFEDLTSENMAAVFYNRGVHPSLYSDMFGKVHKGFGHAAMLAQTNASLWTVGFNINNTSSGDRYVVPANPKDEEERISIKDGKIVAVGSSSEELVVGDWYSVYRLYMESVDIKDSSAHSMTKEDLQKLILNRIKNPPSSSKTTLSAA